MARPKKIATLDTQAPETRQFKMHPDLLFSVIKSQAGTHEKALLEAIMNAVDAGASKCEIEIDTLGYNIKDDGKGFASRQEIEDFFETFGTPHKEGDATYGKFRMGRGQLFAFSRTIWHSNQFTMDVCIRSRGLDYDLKDNAKPYKGCHIKGIWHDKLKGSELLTIVRDLKQLVRYMQIPVIVNGEDIAIKPENQKWDFKLDEAYIKLSKNEGALSVYNLGALVANYPAYRFGTGGVIVSRVPFAVNFARNDILVSQCKVWKKVSAKMNELLGHETEKKTVLTESERIALVNQLLEQSIYFSQVMSKGLLMDITSKKPTFNKLLNIKRLSFSSGKLRHVEEKIHEEGIAFILDKSMLSRFMVATPEEFVAKINDLIKLNNEKAQEERNKRNYSSPVSSIWSKFEPAIVDIEELHNSFKSTNVIVDDKKLTKKEKCVLKALSESGNNIHAAMKNHLRKLNDENSNKNALAIRKIKVGESETASAWTDGANYIAFNRKEVNQYHAQELITIMVHEYCHTDSTMESHSHGIEFYELFHDVMRYESDIIAYAIINFQKTLVRELVKANIKPNGSLENNMEISEKALSFSHENLVDA